MSKLLERLKKSNIEFMSDDELLALPAGSEMVFDVECYWNFFYLAFKSLENSKYTYVELSPACELNVQKLQWILWRFKLVGFNSENYDLPIIVLATKGFDNKALKLATNYIIQGGHNKWDFEKEYKIRIPNYNHIDIMNVAPLQGSLKLYAGRLHCETMQDLPYEEDETLTQDQAEEVRYYCCNDLNNTELLYKELIPQIKLREKMSALYQVDLRSKSDAQIAEKVISEKLTELTGKKPTKTRLPAGYRIKFSTPDFIDFKTDAFKKVLGIVEATEFELDKNGRPLMPESLEKLTISMGNTQYKFAMGGLHSQESEVCYRESDDFIIADNDVESFYPRIILNQKLRPEHLGEQFLTVYNGIVTERLAAKKSGNKVVADSLKIVINGSFGKFGNKYSILYSPQLLLQVTLTGQLSLLMLIEQLELAGIPCVSGNTDGVVSRYSADQHEKAREVISMWEQQTGFKTEETRYRALYSRDVNNYIAIKYSSDPEAKFIDEQLGCKVKGTYSERGSALNSVLSKNPEHLICSDAVLQFLVKRKPIKETVENCTDIKRFVSVRNVKGGAIKNMQYLGKTIRWYYSKNEYDCIEYKTNGNKVPKTDGAKPLMDLPNSLPEDINYNWYIDKANEMLYDIGRFKKAKTERLF